MAQPGKIHPATPPPHNRHGHRRPPSPLAEGLFVLLAWAALLWWGLVGWATRERTDREWFAFCTVVIYVAVLITVVLLLV